MPPYTYPPEQCDVEDQKKLVAYRQAVTRWFEWLHADPEHSISSQLSDLLWQDAVFRVFNEARRYVDEDGPTSSVAPILAQFIDRGYVASQVLGISKLVEWSD